MAVSNVMPESASRLERKRIRNRDALVVAARRLFSRDGFEATTIADIAEAADLGFGTFYRYFPDKEAVLEAVLDDGWSQIHAALFTVEPEGTPASVALVRLSERFVHHVRRNLDVLSLMWEVAMRKTVGRRPLKASVLGREQSLPMALSAAIRLVVERGIADGEFAPGDPTVLSHLISGAHFSLIHPATRTIDEPLVIDTVCEFELRALTPAAASARRTADPVPHTARRRAVGGH
jgi:AcrR family transcriptional regulator